MKSGTGEVYRNPGSLSQTGKEADSMTTNAIDSNTKAAKDRLDRLEHLCAHLEHMLIEAFDRTEEASMLCQGEAKDKMQRAGASLSIAMEFREEIVRHVEALQAA